MKLVVFCLFAVCCSSLANPLPDSRRKLQEVLRQLDDVKASLQKSDQMLHTPPNNIDDCCSLSALKCFQANLQVHFNLTERNQKQFNRSLRHSLTESGLDFCNSQNVKSTCQDCDSHPKKNATEFFIRLESLIEQAINRLSMN